MRAHYHPDRDALERFAHGRATAVEEVRIERHLRTGCSHCQAEVDRLLPADPEVCAASPAGLAGLEAAGYLASRPATAARPDEAAWERVLAGLEQRLALVIREREAAPQRLAELLCLSAEARQERIASDSRFHSLAICELLIDESFDEGFQDPRRALQTAELAVAVADRLETEHYGISLVHDLRARAWAYLGNACRIRGDFAGAERALARAEALADAGSADPLEEARILDLRASLLADQGFLEEASDLLDVVIEICDEIRDQHRKGRALLSKGLFQMDSGEPERAVDLITAGLSLIRWDEEPRLVLIARYNLVDALIESGRCEQARLQIEHLRLTLRGSSHPWMDARLLWLEGRLATGLDRLDEAEALLHETQRLFLELGRDYDATLVTLDLAKVHLRQGKDLEVRQLADSVLPCLLTRNRCHQAITALIAFQQAAEMDRLTSPMVQGIASYLLRARRNPGLPFYQAATA
jgi:tetratricopeptide (TPR) repeat protein